MIGKRLQNKLDENQAVRNRIKKGVSPKDILLSAWKENQFFIVI